MKNEIKTIAEKAFEDYLRKQGYSEMSKSGNKSTVYDYPTRVKRICERENLRNFDDLALRINDIVEKYDKDGEKSAYGAQSNGSNIKALKLFKEFIVTIS